VESPPLEYFDLGWSFLEYSLLEVGPMERFRLGVTVTPPDLGLH
jgi:hypothetical protein